MRVPITIKRAAACAATAAAAAVCLPSASSTPDASALDDATISPMPALFPLQRRAKIVPRFRAAPIHRTPTTPLPPPLPDEYHTHRLYNPGARPALMSPMAGPSGPASTLVSRILQVALGLFVTTMELPPLPADSDTRRAPDFDCDFSAPCRWISVGATPERWRLARGEPDVLLWLAATGTMVLPAEPFTLIEIRGGTPVDMLSSDVIPCQREASLFGFTYWTIGLSDLEICLLDLHYRQFNCTGMLQSHIQPGKVALKIPPVKHPFRIAIIPSIDQGILILDDIKYDAKYCGDSPTVIQTLPAMTTVPFGQIATAATLGLSGPTVFPFLPGPTTTTTTTTTVVPLPFPPLTFAPIVPPFVATPTPRSTVIVQPSSMVSPLTGLFTPPPYSPITLAPLLPFWPLTSFPQTAPTLATVFSYVTPRPIVIVPEPMEPFFSTSSTAPPVARPQPTDAPEALSGSFDLLIYGNRTAPLFDRRRGEIVNDPTDLLCDFGNNFPCLWGPSGGKWAIIEKGAIPSLEFGPMAHKELPVYPALVVIQGTAILTSDPLPCQSGEGKLLFRYWTNGRVIMQVCAMGYGPDSEKTQCVEEVTRSMEQFGTTLNGPGAAGGTMDPPTLAVFTLPHEVHSPFTLNIIPIFERNSRNTFLVIDEIAYIGECNRSALADGSALGARNLATPKSGGVWSRVDSTGDEDVIDVVDAGSSVENLETNALKGHIGKMTATSTTIAPWPRRLTLPTRRLPKINSMRPTELEVGAPMDKLITTTRWTTKGTRYPFSLTSPIIRSTTTPSSSSSSELSSRAAGSATTYVSHTVGGRPTTFVYPESRRFETTSTTRGSFVISQPSTPPANATTNEEPYVDYCKLLNCDFNAPSNGQFVSALIGPDDFAILESPHFNHTQGINVLLFQYYRPTHSSAIRLCLGTRYTKPYRSVASFLQCPPILRSLTSKNAFKWNSVHIQLPPGTSHFYLVAHNLARSAEKSAIAIDNIRVAICDPRSYAPPHTLDALEEELNAFQGQAGNDEEETTAAMVAVDTLSTKSPRSDDAENADSEPAIYRDEG